MNGLCCLDITNLLSCTTYISDSVIRVYYNMIFDAVYTNFLYRNLFLGLKSQSQVMTYERYQIQNIFYRRTLQDIENIEKNL